MNNNNPNIKPVEKRIKKIKDISNINNTNKEKIKEYEDSKNLITSYENSNKNFDDLNSKIVQFSKDLLNISTIQNDDNIIQSFKEYIDNKYILFNDLSTIITINIKKLKEEFKNKNTFNFDLHNELSKIKDKYASKDLSPEMRTKIKLLQVRYLNLIDTIENKIPEIKRLIDDYTDLNNNLEIIKDKKFKNLFKISYNKIVLYYEKKIDKNTSTFNFEHNKELNDAELIPKLLKYKEIIASCRLYITEYNSKFIKLINNYKKKKYY